MVHNSALWFIPCLFAVEIIYFFYSKMKEWVTLTLCFATALIGGILVHLYGDAYLFLLPWNLDAALFALPFYGVGNTIRRHLSNERIMNVVTNNRIIFSIGVIVMFIIMSYLSIYYGECSMGSSSYQCNLFVFFLRAISMYTEVWLQVECSSLIFISWNKKIC